MELRSPRPGFSLDALIAEAKRRAAQRRLLVLMAILIVAAVAAAVTFGSSGGGSRPGGAAGKLGSPSSGSQSAQIGPFSVSVPRGFHVSAPRGSRNLTIDSAVPPTQNGVELVVGFFASAKALAFRAPLHVPLNIHKLDASGGRTVWSGTVSGGGSLYRVILFLGRKASAADRAAILRALNSIRRTG